MKQYTISLLSLFLGATLYGMEKQSLLPSGTNSTKPLSTQEKLQIINETSKDEFFHASDYGSAPHSGGAVILASIFNAVTESYKKLGQAKKNH